MEKYLYQDLYELEDLHWWHIAKRELIIKFTKNFYPNKKPKILDIGCGAGKNLEALSSIANTFGIDNSKEAIKFCQKRGLSQVTLAPSNKTGFSPHSLDEVTLLDVLEHVEEDKTLQEIKHILKKTGILLITVPAYPWLWSKWDEVLFHKRRYTKKSLQNILQKNGFSIIKISYLYPHLLIPVFLIRLLKSKSKKKAYGSDFKLINPLLNFILLTIAKFQTWYISNIGSIPFGTGIFCVAINNEKN